ncbi:MAG: hypothetical protein H6822_02310 [Planctomycetaceae bacterium]|nr:hypothetical protein [Planctomycetales bacterium]MCB9920984.1 hypothetical protein [Planctomycetaceae bacterium]
MHVRKPLVVCTTAFLMLSVFDSAGFAHNTGRSHRHNSRSSRTTRSSASAAAKANADLMRAAAVRAAALRAAQAEVSRAHAALKSSRTLLERQFELSPQVAAALREDAAAHKELDQLRQVVLDRLAKDPLYQNAKRIQQEKYNEAQALRASGRASQSQIDALSQQRLEAGATVTKMEAAAINDDPAARKASERVVATAARVNELKRGFESSVTHDSRWTAARKDLDDARRKLAQANVAGNQALANANRSRTNQRYSARP